jgi:hypothetical protein
MSWRVGYLFAGALVLANRQNRPAISLACRTRFARGESPFRQTRPLRQKHHKLEPDSAFLRGPVNSGASDADTTGVPPCGKAGRRIRAGNKREIA